MGLHFGQLEKIRGIIYYRLSPYEQRAFAGAISRGIPNIIRRFRENIFIVTPPFIVSYLFYDTIEKQHKALTRKNPADYENEQ